MEKQTRIASFDVNHMTLNPGIYISRIDDNIVTYDIRTCKPNTGKLMSNSEMHSVEHLFATYIRNSTIGSRVIYFGPMGCQTGYYLLIRDSNHEETVNIIKSILLDIAQNADIMSGYSAEECGNYLNLDLELAKKACLEYYKLFENVSAETLNY